MQQMFKLKPLSRLKLLEDLEHKVRYVKNSTADHACSLNTVRYVKNSTADHACSL